MGNIAPGGGIPLKCFGTLHVPPASSLALWPQGGDAKLSAASCHRVLASVPRRGRGTVAGDGRAEHGRTGTLGGTC